MTPQPLRTSGGMIWEALRQVAMAKLASLQNDSQTPGPD